jgi:hypothetical protein
VSQPAYVERHEWLPEIMLALPALRITEGAPGDSIKQDGKAIIVNDFSNWTSRATPAGLCVAMASTAYHRNTAVADARVII